MRQSLKIRRILNITSNINFALLDEQSGYAAGWYTIVVRRLGGGYNLTLAFSTARKAVASIR